MSEDCIMTSIPLTPYTYVEKTTLFNHEDMFWPLQQPSLVTK